MKPLKPAMFPPLPVDGGAFIPSPLLPEGAANLKEALDIAEKNLGPEFAALRESMQQKVSEAIASMVKAVNDMAQRWLDAEPGRTVEELAEWSDQYGFPGHIVTGLQRVRVEGDSAVVTECIGLCIQRMGPENPEMETRIYRAFADTFGTRYRIVGPEQMVSPGNRTVH